MTKNKPLKERFIDKIADYGSTGCWNFTSSISQSGCGTFFKDGRNRDAYRVSYELFVGQIPKGLHLHHICENRACVNPKHLLPVTPREHHANLTPHHLAYINSRKTHCPRGHEYTKENLVKYILEKRNGRRCLICARKASCDSQRKRRMMQKEKLC